MLDADDNSNENQKIYHHLSALYTWAESWVFFINQAILALSLLITA